MKFLRALLRNLLLLIVSLVFAFVLLELSIRDYVRAFPFQPHEKISYLSHLTDKDKTLKWRYPPNQDGRNSLGLKNEEITPKKDQYRILFLGDSFLWTGLTSSRELYSEVIEKNLNQTSTKEIEVINAGIPGYTVYQELEFLKIYGLSMKPDMVVVHFAFNDVYYPYLHRPSNVNLFKVEPSVRLHRFNTQYFPGILFSKSYAAHFLAEWGRYFLRKISNYPVYHFEKRVDFYLAWKDYGWVKTRELIGEMKTLLDEKQISLIIVVYPNSDQLKDEYLKADRDYVLYPQKQIREICDSNGIPMFDLTEPIYNHGGTKLFKEYLHMNLEGNDLLAAEIAKFLDANIKKSGIS